MRARRRIKPGGLVSLSAKSSWVINPCIWYVMATDSICSYLANGDSLCLSEVPGAHAVQLLSWGPRVHGKELTSVAYEL